jgi:histidinol-phosphate aminotransferase
MQLKLADNINPYGPGEAARAAMLDACRRANVYQDGAIDRLAARIAEVHDVPRRSVYVSPGSTALLRAATVGFTDPSRGLVVGAPTFELPGDVAQASGVSVDAVPLTPTGLLDLAAMRARAHGAGLIYVCNPNNPTGGAHPLDALADFAGAVRANGADAVIVFDEAYLDYATDASMTSAVALTKCDSRVLVFRTFSKIHGLAGLRVGYAIGHPEVLRTLERGMSRRAVSGASAQAALAALDDAEHIARQVALNRSARDYTTEAFQRAGVAVMPSQANFVMIDVRRDAALVRAMCGRFGIQLARVFPPLMHHVRTSIGTMEEMQAAVKAMRSILKVPSDAHVLR